MKQRAGLAVRVWFLAAGSLLLLGCPNPNTYTTPRTIGWGHFQGSVAVEAFGYYTPAMAAYGLPASSEASPTAPTFALRFGLSDAWEVGARFANSNSPGGDVKWNFLRSSRLDLAIDPAFQIYNVETIEGPSSEEAVRFIHLPLLVGVNLSRTVTLVFTPGASWGFTSSGPVRFKGGPDQGAASGTIARFGLGADFRVEPGFTLHPEVTFFRSLGGDGTIVYVAGLGFNFGAMPSYDDVGAGPPPTAAPPEDATP